MVYSLSVIIPCYNESDRLADCLAGIRTFLSASAVFEDGDIEWIFVDDGSTDDTRSCLERHAADDPHARVVVQPTNQGKGAAVRAGDAVATAPIRAFTDVDLSSPLDALEQIQHLFAESGPDLIIASRHAPSARLAVPPPSTSRRTFPQPSGSRRSSFRKRYREIEIWLPRTLIRTGGEDEGMVEPPDMPSGRRSQQGQHDGNQDHRVSQ